MWRNIPDWRDVKDNETKPSRDDLLGHLRRLADAGDTETQHVLADLALLEYINDPEVTEAFENIDKWYA